MAELGLTVDIGANIGAFKTQMKAVGMDVEAIQKALKTSFTGLNKLAEKYPGHFEEALSYAKELDKYLKQLSKQKSPITLQQQAKVSTAANQYTSLVAGAPAKKTREEEAARKAVAKAVREEEKAVQALERAQAKQAAAEARQQKEALGNIIRARYALYDVANEGRRVGLIMVGLGLAAAKVGGDFEKAFNNVERTTGLTGAALENLRQTLVEISQTTPVSFKDITSIATLGAQMGIAAGGVDEFASTVSKFSAVTGVSVDTAATSFGRIAQLLNVSASEYENLASAVLYAGRNSIATEEQILTLTSQIAASAQQAGFAADETIGLATALASLGIAPEQARGVILRLFADFDKAVSENGKTLADYASLMGGTVDQVRALWQNDPAQFFTAFTDSLAKTGQTAGGVNNVLSALGIVETREVNVLQRLAGNQDLVQQSMENAGASYASNTDLAEQYGMQTDNLNDKLAKLGNNLLALSAAIGGTLGVVLKPIIDLLSGFVAMVANNPIAMTIATISTVVAAGAGIFLLYKAAVAQAIASTFALRTTMLELQKEGIKTTITMSGLRTELLRTAEAGGVATGGISKASLSIAGMKTAASSAVATLARFIPQMAIIGGIMAVAAIETDNANKRLKEMAKNFDDVAQSGKSLDNVAFLNPDKRGISSLNNITGELSDFQTQLKETASFANTFSNALFGVVGLGDVTTLSMAKKDLAGVDEALASLVADGKLGEAARLYEELKIQAAAVGVEQKQLSEEFLPNYTAAVQGAIPATNDLTDAELSAAGAGENLADIIKTRLIESMIGATSQQSKFIDSVMTFSESLAKSKGSVSVWANSGRKALSSFEDLLSSIASISGNNMGVALQMTAAAIRQIESAGGNASVQVQGLVTRLNSMYGLNLNGATVTSIAQLQALIASTGGIASATRAEIAGLLSGGGYAGLMQKAFDAAKKSINGAGSAVKKQIRTVKTYASELSGLFGDIYDRAFSLTEATDGFDAGWVSIKDRVNDAKESVKDLQAELDTMTADRSILQYQLGIAEKYGDQLRAAKIRAQLLKLDKEITSKTAEKAKAQEESSLSLKDNTEAARANREEIRAQVKDAGELIAAYASTAKANGKLPTKAEVSAYAKTVSQNFRDQATAIGFTSDELDNYAKIIAGFGTAAKSVQNPNVGVKLSPITTAVNAYLAEKKETKVNVGVGNSDTLLTELENLFKSKTFTANVQISLPGTIPGLGVNALGPLASGYVFQQPSTKTAATKTQRDLLASYEKSLATAQATLKAATKAGSYSGSVSASNSVANWRKKIDDLKAKYAFATGGYVSGPGSSTSDSIMAQLSNGEYVIQANAVDRYGIDFMNSLNQMRVGMPAATAARSSSSSNVVYLSPEDRSLLRAAADRPITLYTENTKIAQSANAGNVVLAQRGTN